MKLIGLTGGIASGKSTVSGMLREQGATVLDADAVYHALITPERGEPSPLARAIEARFAGVLRPDGGLDRAALGQRVFGDRAALEALGSITHPAVATAVAVQVSAYRESGLDEVVYDVPLLYERGLDAGMHAVIVVWVSRETQLQRLRQRDAIDPDVAERKLASQMSLDDKRARADHVIDNDGTRSNTREQVVEVWELLRRQESLPA